MKHFKHLLLSFCASFFCICSFAKTPDAHTVFQLTVTPISHQVVLNWTIQPGYYLYKERIEIPSAVDIQWPKALNHRDRLGKIHEIYRKQLQLKIPLPSNHQIVVRYQGCSDSGICFPPQVYKKHLSSSSKFSFVWTLLGFLGLGALMAFTPCVLPMLPVMTKVVIGTKPQTKKQIWGLGISYVLGMSISYALVGAVLSQVGKNLFMLMQNSMIIRTMAVLYIGFGFATLDWIKIQLPQKLQSKSMQVRSLLPAGRYGSAALMGSLSLLVLSPCVTAPLLGALTFITQMGEVWKGTFALFTLGLGMGLPLMIFAVSAGHLLPKAGAWMNNVKTILAILLFSVAALLVSRTLVYPNNQLPWVAVLLMTTYLIRPRQHQGPAKHWRTIVMLGLCVLSLFICYGTIRPGAMPWPFYQAQQTPLTIPTNNIAHAIKTSQKPVILYFTAKWCATCQYLEKNVWPKQALRALFQNYEVIQVDVTKNRKEDLKIMQQFAVIAPPTLIKLSKDQRLSGEEITVKHLQAWID